MMNIKTALITANVFHNSLSSLNPDAELYLEYLGRLRFQPITWYMSLLDYCSIMCFWEMFNSSNDLACQEIYLGMQSILRLCKVDEYIQEEARLHRMYSVSEAVRLACAIDRSVDAIVTWEPHHFARSKDDENQVKRDGYFMLKLKSEYAEYPSCKAFEIGVFSVRAFLLQIDQSACVLSGSAKYDGFYIERVYVNGGDDYEHSESRVIIRHSAGRVLEDVAIGISPIDALQKAIDKCVNRCFHLPARRISRFHVRDAPIYGAGAPVEVVIGVECGENSFEACATRTSVYRAASDAYIKIINSICGNAPLY